MKFVYEIQKTDRQDSNGRIEQMYFVEYFIRTNHGISPDKVSETMTLAQLLKWLSDAEVA